MRLVADLSKRLLVVDDARGRRELELFSPESFAEVSKIWLKVGWMQRYSYSFAWFGRPVIQLPEDLVRMQEAIFAVQPDVLIETGVAHGGSLVFYASLFKGIGRGRVIGVDVEIRSENRKAIESHALSPFIKLIEGNSTSPEVIRAVQGEIAQGEKVMVVLDSDHRRGHVLRELESYGPLVSTGSYAVATDGVMANLVDLPGVSSDWADDNPAVAAQEFVRDHTEFVLESPPRPFDQSAVDETPTYWPHAWIKRLGDG